MNGDCPVFDMTLVAAADLTASMYRVVKIDSNGKAALAVSGDGMFFLQNSPKAGTAAAVRVHGISFAIAGAAITAGAKVTSDANAAVVAAVATKNAIGIALKAATAAGEVIPVLMGVAPVLA